MNNDNIINFQDIRKKKVVSSQSNKEHPLQIFSNFRRDLISQLDKIYITLQEFENTELVYSSEKILTRPQIDNYLTTKLSFLLSNELLKRVDTQVKISFPDIFIPPVTNHKF